MNSLELEWYEPFSQLTQDVIDGLEEPLKAYNIIHQEVRQSYGGDEYKRALMKCEDKIAEVGGIEQPQWRCCGHTNIIDTDSGGTDQNAYRKTYGY